MYLYINIELPYIEKGFYSIKYFAMFLTGRIIIICLYYIVLICCKASNKRPYKIEAAIKCLITFVEVLENSL